MTTFYLVRHGETLWNKEQRLQGWLDSPLSEDGILHAEKLGNQFTNVPFVAAYSSSSGRAKETLHYLTKDKNIPIYYEDDLREINLGNWQGQTIEAIKAYDGLAYEVYMHYPAQFKATHTESFGAVTERGMYSLKNIAKKYPNETVLVVSHGVTIKCIVNAILERSIDQLWSEPMIEDTSVTIIEQQGQNWHVKEIGNTYHLR